MNAGPAEAMAARRERPRPRYPAGTALSDGRTRESGGARHAEVRKNAARHLDVTGENGLVPFLSYGSLSRACHLSIMRRSRTRGVRYRSTRNNRTMAIVRRRIFRIRAENGDYAAGSYAEHRQVHGTFCSKSLHSRPCSVPETPP